MSDNLAMAELLLPDVTQTPEQIAAQYSWRQLGKKAKVTRFAPSPTGFLHIGGLFAALVNARAAGEDGVFFLRIEDTDKKREVEDGVTGIIAGLSNFGVTFTEGMTGPDTWSGDYGPYLQSARRDIYRVYAKKLVLEGLAYPCFCTAEELDELRKRQEAEKQNPGYYGKWAVHRDISYEQAKQYIDEGRPFVLRLRSPGSPDRRVSFKDAVKGKIEMPENEQDIVLLKADGVPTYHFAHVVDDHLMGTTHVIRGDEWISSAPIHLQLFSLLGWKPPVYAHIAPIMKEENGGKRKLSKRKDPEANVEYYREIGYPMESVIEYLLTIANSNYEDWRRMNPGVDNREFPFALNKMSQSGALFDLHKLADVSKNTISVQSAGWVYERAAAWAKDFDPELYVLLTRDPAYSTAMFAIDRTPVKPRKDIAKWSDVRDYVSYFFDKTYENHEPMPENVAKEDIVKALKAYAQSYDETLDKDGWFAAMKELCPSLGFASEVKAYKKDPDSYRGHVGDLSGFVRIAVTGRRNTPDLHAIMQLLGKERVLSRLNDTILKLEGN
ncbi:MAG: glutamate--tRNA ligase [Clostridiales bacterium]|nr:glutamate--tRNA ligase [Clostridiales bacterium]